MEKFLQTVRDLRDLLRRNKGSPDLVFVADGEKNMRTALSEVPEEKKIEALTQAVAIMDEVVGENPFHYGVWPKYDLAERLRRKENKT